MKKVVTERALLARVNRALAHQEQVMRTNRADTRAHEELGRYYIVNTDTNGVDEWHVDLEYWAQQLGVLQEWEELEELDH